MKEIEVLVRAIIKNKGKILVCKKLNKRYYFFPGGHVEFGESAKEALSRELKEELGLKIKKISFIGGSEHVFVEDGIKHHEINLALDVKADKLKLESKENHIQFFLIDKNRIAKENILPIVLKRAILGWFKDKKMFWVSQINS
jgi:ADP-ribose pyrophosphatase YjhB (NUDIX family)